MASILLLLLCLVSIISLAPAQPIYSLCNRERNFTSNSVYQTSLNRLILSLSSSAPATGFAEENFGQNPDRVFGLAICRGDLDAAACRKCLNNSTRDAATECPGNKGATIFYELCHIRYSDEDFFGKSTGSQYFMWNVNNVSDVPTFNRLLGSLLNNLTQRAAASERKFAAGSVDFTDFQKIYALVQCTRDLSPETCDVCLKNQIGDIPSCCGAKQGARVIGGSCYLRFEVGPFFNAAAAAEPPPPSPPTSLPNSTPPASPSADDKKNNTVIIVVAVSIAVVVVVLVLTTIGICIRKKRKFKKLSGGRDEDDVTQNFSSHYSLETLKLATMNFSDQNKLGEGGFGVVYKGILGDGQMIAVKRLVTNSNEGLKEIRNEVNLVAELQHRNLVRLLGYCLEAQEKILVYEYLPNKSLDKFLFDPIRSKLLTWEKRVKIIEGIARGLLYLHEDSRLKIIHRDLKASNILLDEDMNPKIADFGLARLFGNEQSYGNTRQIAGTHGYMAPEYMMHGQMSTKSDVYSFGVLLLEILSGKKCIGFHGSSPPTDFISYVRWHWGKGNPVEVLDKAIEEGFLVDEVLRRINIGLLCVQYDPLERPSMSQVVLMLSSNSTSLPAVSTENGFSESRSMDNSLQYQVPGASRNMHFSIATDTSTLEAR